MFTTRKVIAGAVSGALCLSMLAAGAAALEAPKAASDINVDGKLDEAHWAAAEWTPITVKIHEGANNDAKVAITWDNDNLYIAWKIVDDVIVTDPNGLGSGRYTHDGVEVFLEQTDAPGDAYTAKTAHIYYSHSQGDWNVQGLTAPDIWTDTDELETLVFKSVNTDDGYTVEMSVAFADIYAEDIAVGSNFAFGTSNNDDDDAVSFADADRLELDLTEGHKYNTPSTWSTFTLADTLKLPEVKPADPTPSTSADTFDMTAIALAATAISAAAFAVSKKKSK